MPLDDGRDARLNLDGDDIGREQRAEAGALDKLEPHVNRVVAERAVAGRRSHNSAHGAVLAPRASCDGAVGGGLPRLGRAK